MHTHIYTYNCIQAYQNNIPNLNTVLARAHRAISICSEQPGPHAMISKREADSLDRACSETRGGISGVVFERSHLKFMRLMMPFRNIGSFMTKEQLQKFPICLQMDEKQQGNKATSRMSKANATYVHHQSSNPTCKQINHKQAGPQAIHRGEHKKQQKQSKPKRLVNTSRRA